MKIQFLSYSSLMTFILLSCTNLSNESHSLNVDDFFEIKDVNQISENIISNSSQISNEDHRKHIEKVGFFRNEIEEETKKTIEFFRSTLTQQEVIRIRLIGIPVWKRSFRTGVNSEKVVVVPLVEKKESCVSGLLYLKYGFTGIKHYAYFSREESLHSFLSDQLPKTNKERMFQIDIAALDNNLFQLQYLSSSQLQDPESTAIDDLDYKCFSKILPDIHIKYDYIKSDNMFFAGEWSTLIINTSRFFDTEEPLIPIKTEVTVPINKEDISQERPSQIPRGS